MKCEDGDPGCKACHGQCERRATVCLVRIDFEDKWGTMLCRPCADDALDSGFFREDIAAGIGRTRKGA